MSVNSASFRTFVGTSSTIDSVDADVDDNPLLRDFEFPPFDVVQAKHVRPAIRALLSKLVLIDSLLISCLVLSV